MEPDSFPVGTVAGADAGVPKDDGKRGVEGLSVDGVLEENVRAGDITADPWSSAASSRSAT